jgi:hypothetical protein
MDRMPAQRECFAVQRGYLTYRRSKQRKQASVDRFQPVFSGLCLQTCRRSPVGTSAFEKCRQETPCQ